MLAVVEAEVVQIEARRTRTLAVPSCGYVSSLRCTISRCISDDSEVATVVSW